MEPDVRNSSDFNPVNNPHDANKGQRQEITDYNVTKPLVIKYIKKVKKPKSTFPFRPERIRYNRSLSPEIFTPKKFYFLIKFNMIL